MTFGSIENPLVGAFVQTMMKKAAMKRTILIVTITILILGIGGLSPAGAQVTTRHRTQMTFNRHQTPLQQDRFGRIGARLNSRPIGGRFGGTIGGRVGRRLDAGASYTMIKRQPSSGSFSNVVPGRKLATEKDHGPVTRIHSYSSGSPRRSRRRDKMLVDSFLGLYGGNQRQRGLSSSKGINSGKGTAGFSPLGGGRSYYLNHKDITVFDNQDLSLDSTNSMYDLYGP